MATQCNLLTATEIDPETLPYEQKMIYYLKDFCFSTTAHGIPMIAAAHNAFIRGFWSVQYLVLTSIRWHSKTL